MSGSHCARLSGSPLIERSPIGHVLNTRAVARRYAKELGRPYESLRLIVRTWERHHSVGASRRPADRQQTPLKKAHSAPTGQVACRFARSSSSAIAAASRKRRIDHKVFGDGGLYAYLKTRDLEEIERRIEAGDTQAALVLEAMIYQIAKEAGAMAAVLEGKVNAVLLTGGMAHSERCRPATARPSRMDRAPSASPSRRRRVAGTRRTASSAS